VWCGVNTCKAPPGRLYLKISLLVSQRFLNCWKVGKGKIRALLANGPIREPERVRRLTDDRGHFEGQQLLCALSLTLI